MVNYDDYNNNNPSQGRGSGVNGNGGNGVSKRGLFTRRGSSSGGRGNGSDNNRGNTKKGIFARPLPFHRNRGNRQQPVDYSGDEEWAGSNNNDSRSRTSKSDPPSSSNFKAHPWILPPYLRLAPRIDTWFAFAIASCAAVASIGQIHSSSQGSDVLFRSGDKFALSTCCLSFIFSFAMAMGLRYAPLRTVLTRGLVVSSTTDNGARSTARNAGAARGISQGIRAFLSSLDLTFELLLLSFLLIFWMASMPIIVNGNAHYNSNSNSGAPLAMAGADIWNANLFYSSWVSFLVCGYLWVEVYTLQDRRGTLKLKVDNDNHHKMNNTFTKRWTFLLVTSVIIMSSSIATYTSPACTGSLFRQTNYCKRALIGITIGGVLQLLILLAVGALYRLSHMNPALLHSQLRNSRMAANRRGESIVSVRERDTGAAICAILSFIVQSVNAGLLTSPTGGGPGSTGGTLYFGSWLGFIFGFELCLRYLEFYSTANSSAGANGNRRGINLSDDVTAHEDEDDDDDEYEEERLLELRSGSEDGNGRKQLWNSSGHVVTVDDDSDGEGDTIDGKSFVFGAAAPPAARAGRSTPTSNVTGQGSAKERIGGGSMAPSITTPSSVPSTKMSLERKDSPPSFHTHESYGRGLDPEDGTASTISGSDPVGSIDVRSTSCSRSGDEATSNLSKKNSDPDGTFTNRTYSGHYDDFNDDYQDIRNSAFFDTNVQQHSRTNEPESPQRYTSFHMDQVEDLDDPQGAVGAVLPTPRHPSNVSHLSPLLEASGEDVSPNTDESGLPTGSSGQVGDNLRTMEAMRRVIHQQQQQASSSKKSGTSTKSSRSRSRENKGGGGQVSRQSGASATASRKTAQSVSTRSVHSSHSKRSMGSRLSSAPSASTMSSMAGSAILTDDESTGSNPPPTISDGMSTKESLSGFSALSNKSGGNQNNGNDRGGPPPPPFRRSAGQQQQQQHSEYDAASQYSSKAPVQSVHTKGSLGETDTIVSDPTLDAGFDPVPPSPLSKNRKQQEYHESSGSTNSYDKKYSDETEISDENPSSHEGGGSGIKVVDNIVAAALAYAEKTHGESDNHGLQRAHRGGSGSASGSMSISNNIRPPTKSTSFPIGGPGVAAQRPMQQQRKHKPSKSKHRASSHTDDASSSIHSFYTESENGGGGGGGDMTHSTGNPRFAQAAPVDDLVAKALSHALGQLDGKQPQQPQQRPAAVQAPKTQKHRKSEQSSSHWSSAGKSVGSMYSEDTEFSNQDMAMGYDC